MTTADYLTSLQNDLATIKQHLSDGGMTISEDDNFSNIATKTDGIQIGGGADFNITDCTYLFYTGMRMDAESGLLPLVKNCTTCYRMYYNNTLVRNAQLFDTSGCTDFRQMLYGATSLKSIPSYDLSSATNLSQMFYNCSWLETIGNYSVPNATNMQNMFKNDGSLTSDSLNKILAMCITATNCPTKTLSYIGLDSTQIATCQTLSNYSDFVSAGWSAS